LGPASVSFAEAVTLPVGMPAPSDSRSRSRQRLHHRPDAARTLLVEGAATVPGGIAPDRRFADDTTPPSGGLRDGS
jgi:hypothetical protein